MTLTGKALAAELHELWHAARVLIPQVAEVYLDANGAVADTGAHMPDSMADGAKLTPVDAKAFVRKTSRGTHSTGQIYPHWQALRDEFQKILGETATNLEDTARTLENVVNAYARTDQEAADELKRLIDREQRNSDSERRQNPGAPPTDDFRPRPTDLPDPVMPEG